MARNLYALMPDAEETELTFHAPGRAQAVSLSQLKASDQLVIFAPGHAVLMTSAVVSARNETEARLSAPFVIEDDIASTAETTHVALGPKVEMGHPREMYAVDAELMARWTEWIEDLGLQNAKLVPEPSVLPEGAVLNSGSRLLLRVDDNPISVDLALPAALQKAILGDLVLPAPEEDGGLSRLMSYAETAPELINLRQGRFRPRQSLRLGGLSRLKLTAGLVLAALFAWLGGQWLEVRAMDAEVLRLRTEAYTRYRQAYPDAPASVDPVRAVRRDSSAKQGGPDLDFITVTAGLYQALEEIDGAQLRSLRFDPDRGGLSAAIAYPQFGDDARLKSALEQIGFATRIGDSRQLNNVVIGDVFVEGVR